MNVNNNLEFNFNRDSSLVAENLNGAVFERGEVSVTISATEAFSRRDNDRGQYRQLLELKPGVVYGIPSHNVSIPGLVTENGSCVLLKGGTVREGDVITEATRPSQISKALGLNKKDTANLVLVDPTIPRFRVE